jgi:hypothetical protein
MPIKKTSDWTTPPQPRENHRPHFQQMTGRRSQSELKFPLLSKTISLRPFRAHIAAIRERGTCPCPRCHIPKPELDRVGWVRVKKNCTDRAWPYLSRLIMYAHHCIYKLGHGLKLTIVENVLQPISLVPTVVSAFLWLHF